MYSNPIRIANDTIHLVNAKLPYISTTKVYRMVKHIGAKNNLDAYMCHNSTICDNYAKCCKNEQKQAMKVFCWFSRLIDKLADLSDENAMIKDTCAKINSIFKTIKEQLLVNCGELAIITAVILNMKGIKNVCTASLKSDDTYIDHSVAVFNRDGSDFKGDIINNKTIIVDTWMGIVDYAGNYFSKLRSEYSNFLQTGDGKMGFRNVKKYNLDDQQMEQLRQKYPELLSDTKIRTF